MNYLMVCVGSMFVCVTGAMQGMSRYNQSGLVNSVKRYVFPVTISQIATMNITEKNLELSYQALLAFKQFDVNRTKPKLDYIMQLVKEGASVDYQVSIREEYIEKRFTILYLALVANSIEHTKELLEKGAHTDIVWGVSTIAKTDRPFNRSALEIADMWCDDSGEMQKLIRSYQTKKSAKL